MIVLDTNVVSEMMKPDSQRSGSVVTWLGHQRGERLFLTTITVAEILAGLAIMPDGKQRAGKQDAAERVIGLFRDRILGFDMPATPFYAEAVTIRRREGKSIDAFDIVIGAIAGANGMSVATRNTVDFEDCGIDLINPWEA